MTHRLTPVCLALSTTLTAPAFADVTVADVWSNQQALYDSMGVSLGGTLSNGFVVNPEVNIILPQGLGSFQIRSDDINLSDNGDGTVTMSYPSPMNISVEGGVAGDASFSASLTLTHDGHTIVASGDAGDIAYRSDARNMRITIDEVTSNDSDMNTFAFEGFFAIDSFNTSSRITEGNVITYSATSDVGNSNVDITVTDGDLVSQNVQTLLPAQSVVAGTFPVGGSDVMNLSAALRDGLGLTFESTTAGSTSDSITLLDGAQMTRQTTTTGTQTTSLTFNEDGVQAKVQGSDVATVMNSPMIFPGDIEVGIATMALDYDIPVNASGSPQDFRVATSLAGITIGDTVWNLFDPTGILDRGPAELSFDVTGSGTNGTDLLNFIALSQRTSPPDIEIDDVTIENLRIAVAGAELLAEGTVAFDWSDFTTIPGIARPEGAVTVNLNGANQLMDNLVAMGLIPEDQLMMPRMMMGMFANPVGDDALQTILEVNEQGHVLANGQRLQ